MILLDTNVLSELIRPEPAEPVLAWIRGQAAAELYVSSISYAEILYGIDLMPEKGTSPVNKYLPTRPRKPLAAAAGAAEPDTGGATGFFAWLDGMLDRI